MGSPSERRRRQRTGERIPLQRPKPGARASPRWPPRCHQPRCFPCLGSVVAWACSKGANSLYLQEAELRKLQPRHAGRLCVTAAVRAADAGRTAAGLRHQEPRAESTGAGGSAPGNKHQPGQPRHTGARGTRQPYVCGYTEGSHKHRQRSNF